jgi:mono/diheme cytochrome c family protein
MRTLVLILMIALLPMRMWAAEGMAVRMAADQAASAAGVAATESMPEDCPMMAKAKAEAGSDGAPEAVTHCMACHLCAASACLPEVAFEQGPAPTGPPVASGLFFASAELARDLRPPIS